MTYSYLHLLAPDTTELLRLLNAHGAQGWRLRSCEFCADPQGERKRWEVLMERVIPEPMKLQPEIIAGLISKMPYFDDKWTMEIQDSWWKCYWGLGKLVFSPIPPAPEDLATGAPHE